MTRRSPQLDGWRRTHHLRRRAGRSGHRAVAGLLAVGVGLTTVVSGCADLPPPMPPPDEPFAHPPPLTQRQAARAGRNVTVRIRNIPCGGGLGVGTGFLLDEHTLVTNRHVVEGFGELELETWDGRRLSPEIVDVGTAADLSIVRIDRGVGEAIELASDDPDPGEEVQAVGYALGGPQAVTEGEVVDYVEDSRLGMEGKIMRVDVSVQPGNSGGPLIDGNGLVVGVVYAIEIATDYGLVVPVSTLRTHLQTQGALSTSDGC